MQSALESAQLLLLACLGAERPEFRVFAISGLGWPVGLMDLALDVLARSGSPTPVYISGYGQGYEEIPFPGRYDPMTAGDVSPLLNAFEAGAVVGSPCPMAEVCDRTQDPATVRGALNELSWSMPPWPSGTTPRWAPATGASSRRSRITRPAERIRRPLHGVFTAWSAR